jgi:hypothetical protein
MTERKNLIHLFAIGDHSAGHWPMVQVAFRTALEVAKHASFTELCASLCMS